MSRLTLAKSAAGRKTTGKIEGDIRVNVRLDCSAAWHGHYCGGRRRVICNDVQPCDADELDLRRSGQPQGFPKEQKSFARISGYVEQNDIHTPQLTVRESLVYSAHLRLSSDTGEETTQRFVDEVSTCSLFPQQAPHNYSP